MGGSSSRFGSSTTAEQALDGMDMTGKVAVVTGANTGLGKETTRVLLQGNATVVMACRSLERGNIARTEILQDLAHGSDEKEAESREDRLVLLQLDLSNLENIQTFVQNFKDLNLRCDFLIANAGVMGGDERQTTANGFELQFGTNHIGTFYLTMLMLDKLQESAPCRVIVVSGNIYRYICADINTWLDEHFADDKERVTGPIESEYNANLAYSQSKLFNILFAREFNRRYSSTGVTAVSLHPGVIMATELMRSSSRRDSWVGSAMMSAFRLFTKTLQQGAATTVRLAAMKDDEYIGGRYYMDCADAEAGLRNDVRAWTENVERSPDSRCWNMTCTLLEKVGFTLPE